MFADANGQQALPTDPTAYYNDFWSYAAYYGEAMARTYFSTWSPPEGSPPPPGWVSMQQQVPVTEQQDQQNGTAAYDPEVNIVFSVCYILIKLLFNMNK